MVVADRTVRVPFLPQLPVCFCFFINRHEGSVTIQFYSTSFQVLVPIVYYHLICSLTSQVCIVRRALVSFCCISICKVSSSMLGAQPTGAAAEELDL